MGTLGFAAEILFLCVWQLFIVLLVIVLLPEFIYYLHKLYQNRGERHELNQT